MTSLIEKAWITFFWGLWNTKLLSRLAHWLCSFNFLNFFFENTFVLEAPECFLFEQKYYWLKRRVKFRKLFMIESTRFNIKYMFNVTKENCSLGSKNFLENKGNLNLINEIVSNISWTDNWFRFSCTFITVQLNVRWQKYRNKFLNEGCLKLFQRRESSILIGYSKLFVFSVQSLFIASNK